MVGKCRNCHWSSQHMDCIFHLCSFLVLECKWYFGLFQRGFVCSLHEWLMQSNPIARWHICQGSINGLSFSPDGKYLATVGRDGMSVPLSFLFHTCRSSLWVSDAHFIWQSHTSFLECPWTENWHTYPIGYRSWQCGGSLQYILHTKLALFIKIVQSHSSSRPVMQQFCK